MNDVIVPTPQYKPAESPTGFSVDQIMAPYVLYKIKSRYFWSSSIIQLPVASGPPTTTSTGNAAGCTAPYKQRKPCINIQTHQPVGRKIVAFFLARLGRPCVAPSPVSCNDNETLLNAIVEVDDPVIDSNGGASYYTMKGVYVYSLTRPYFTDDTLSVGSSQADMSTPEDNAIGPCNFKKGIL